MEWCLGPPRAPHTVITANAAILVHDAARPGAPGGLPRGDLIVRRRHVGGVDVARSPASRSPSAWPAWT